MKYNTIQAGAIPATGFVRIHQLAGGVVPLSKSSIWRLVSVGKFPRPVKLSERCTAWRAEDVRAWIESHNATASA
ncbi:MAG: AlpA family phage regulatory protein [Methylobacillus sp.]|nr:AlpA family phage regulatory protein [Methylobacillus sp.]